MSQDNTTDNQQNPTTAQIQEPEIYDDTKLKLRNMYEHNKFFAESINMLNPFFNHFALTQQVDGQTKDYFGYLATSVTQWKQDNVFNKPLVFRAPAVAALTALSFYTTRKGFHVKLIRGLFTFGATSFIFAPEMINPYYNTYMVKWRFPNLKTNSNGTPRLGDWVKEAGVGTLDAVGNFVNGLTNTSNPEPPAQAAEGVQEGNAEAPTEGQGEGNKE